MPDFTACKVNKYALGIKSVTRMRSKYMSQYLNGFICFVKNQHRKLSVETVPVSGTDRPLIFPFCLCIICWEMLNPIPYMAFFSGVNR